MVGADPRDRDKQALLGFLDAQRASVLAIVDGLDEDALRTIVVPSGWTPLGLIEHLGHAERHWFQRVAMGSAAPLPWPDDADEDDDAPFTTSRPAEAVFAFYREQIERANAVLASTPQLGGIAELPRHVRRVLAGVPVELHPLLPAHRLGQQPLPLHQQHVPHITGIFQRGPAGGLPPGAQVWPTKFQDCRQPGGTVADRPGRFCGPGLAVLKAALLAAFHITQHRPRHPPLSNATAARPCTRPPVT